MTALDAPTLDTLAGLTLDYALAMAAAVTGVGSWDDAFRSFTRVNQVGIAIVAGAEHELAYYGGAR